jgi:hypothetical protein
LAIFAYHRRRWLRAKRLSFGFLNDSLGFGRNENKIVKQGEMEKKVVSDSAIIIPKINKVKKSSFTQRPS